MSADLISFPTPQEQLEMSLKKMMRQTKHSVTLVGELWDREDVTPDISTLRTYKNIPLFVYCDLKGSFDYGPEVFSKSKFLGDAFTASDHFKMFQIDNGDAISFVKHPNTPGPHARIKGVCWAVPPETMCVLDRYMANGYRTYRRKFNVFLYDQTYKTSSKGKQVHPSIQAWMYCGLPEYYFSGRDTKIKLKNILTPTNGQNRPYFSHYRGLY